MSAAFEDCCNVEEDIIPNCYPDDETCDIEASEISYYIPKGKPQNE
jgi:hypothetical protein